MQPSDLRHFTVFNEEGELAGVVSDFHDIPGNPVLEVQQDDRTFLVPFHPDLILKTDRKNKHIQIRIPEGLIRDN